MQSILLYVLIAINALTFLVYGIDKLKAKWGKRRISEKTLLAFAALGGSAGALLGMGCFKHKTAKTLFRICVPLFLAIHLGLIWYFAQ
tara:strand:+ start:172 stop:435 length:264 start_codon:yes stop_codon:yes gene_type:complete